MSTKTVVTLIDDLTGEEDDNVRTREFWVDGQGYEIDLGDENNQDFDDFLQNYIEKARKLPKRAAPNSPRTGQRRAATSTSSNARRDPAQSKAIREWAKAQGYEVSDRGRIPAPVEEAYEAQKGRPVAVVNDSADDDVEAGAA